MTAHAKAQNIPKELIYEVFNGKPIYYRGYREVLAGTKSVEQIKWSSILQSFIASELARFFFKKKDQNLIGLLGGIGLQIGTNHHRVGDIAFFQKSVLRSKLLGNKYADIAPQFLIEIDTTHCRMPS